jgi:hypothetical protein
VIPRRRARRHQQPTAPAAVPEAAGRLPANTLLLAEPDRRPVSRPTRATVAFPAAANATAITRTPPA